MTKSPPFGAATRDDVAEGAKDGSEQHIHSIHHTVGQRILTGRAQGAASPQTYRSSRHAMPPARP